MKTYDPTNWYWFVAGNKTQVFSSASGTFVPSSDTTFVAWSADGTIPTNINSVADLGGVLAQASVRPTDATVLDAYTTNAASTVLTHTGFKILFNHENRIRAIERALSLNGSPANLTAAQALAAVKALM